MLPRSQYKAKSSIFARNLSLASLFYKKMSDTKTGTKREISPSIETLMSTKKPRSQSPVLRVGQAGYVLKGLPKGVKKYRRKLANVEPCSHDDVHWRETIDLLSRTDVDSAIDDGTDFDAPFSIHEELELTVSRISSNGEGLAIAPEPRRPWVVIVPFSLPGEKIRARIYRNARLHSFADFLGVEQPNMALRDMSRVKCQYFGACGGCQYQMLSYDTQLEWKKNVVVRAFETFSGLVSGLVPEILPTAPSPLQYGYRTKITPHFDAPQKVPRRRKNKEEPPLKPLPEGTTVAIGFNKVGKREVMDIEECPIATPVINAALGPVRASILENLHTYKKGVSLLLRDSLPITIASENIVQDTHICVTNHRGKVRERVGDMLFEYGASSFFQNNNSVLVSLVEYVRQAIFPDDRKLASSGNTTSSPSHLVDAYCGAGLFSIMLSPYFDKIAGIELSSESIASATQNAQLNSIPKDKISFRAGDAANIFSSVTDFPPEATAVIIDPPRKGCDEKFLDQLLRFKSSTVVYVSCNVHTQARDVGILLRKNVIEDGKEDKRYILESVRGFDLFPQTAHVESVAVLRLV